MKVSLKEFLVNLKADYARDSNIEELVRYFDKCQRFIYLQRPVSATVWKNPSDPKFPYPKMALIAGQRGYTFNTESSFQDSAGNPIGIRDSLGGRVDLHTVTRVFTVDEFGGSDYQTYAQTSNGFVVGGKWCTPVNCSITGLSVYLFDDTQTTVDIFVELTTAPRRVLTTTSETAIDIATWEEALEDGIVGMVERARDGTSVRYETFINKWVPKIQQSMNRHCGDNLNLQVLPRGW